MAKHCSVCDQDYADDLEACPHCASAKKTHLAGRGEDRTTQLAGRSDAPTTQLAEFRAAGVEAAPGPSDSAIDFGLPTTSKPATGDASGEPVSGASEVAWSSLVEEPHAEESKQVEIDSPSDAEMLVHDTEESPATTPAGPHEELVGELEAVEPIVEVTETGVEAEVVESVQLAAATGGAAVEFLRESGRFAGGVGRGRFRGDLEGETFGRIGGVHGRTGQ